MGVAPDRQDPPLVALRIATTVKTASRAGVTKGDRSLRDSLVRAAGCLDLGGTSTLTYDRINCRVNDEFR